MDFDDISFANRPYDPVLAYGQSKTANVLFAVQATHVWASDGITANTVHPGPIMETGLYPHMDSAVVDHIATTYAQQTIKQGASTTVVVATTPELDGVGAATSRTATRRLCSNCPTSMRLDRGLCAVP